MTDSGGNIFSRIPSYSVILIMIVMVVIGAGIMPLLNIQYTPSSKQNSLSVNFRWNGASARVIETEVTSKIEGVLAAVKGVDHVSSVSYREGGRVIVSFKKNVNVDVLRFEIASLMRQIYPKLPEGVSYPSLSSAPSGEQLSPVLIYTLNAGVPSQQIQQYAEENIVKELARIKGVVNIGFSGATPFYVEVCFDPDKLDNFGISIDELHNGIGAIFIWPIAFSLPATFRAAGDAKACMYISSISMWIFRIGFSYVLGKYMGMGVFGIWVAMVIDWVFRAMCFVIRYFKGSWKKNAIV